MNLDQYRAMKAQEQADTTTTEVQPNAQTEQVSTEPVQPSVQETHATEPTQPATGTETTASFEPSADPAPQFFEINGEQVSLEELQRGYLRQSDYTRKTQDLARLQREAKQAQELRQTLEQNPDVAQQIGFNPEALRVQQMEQELADLRLQQEIYTLSTKYPDFNADDAIQLAVERNLTNLEDAYLLNKQFSQFQTPPVAQPPITNQPPIDVESLKAQIRAELQAEMNTSTIISGSGTAPTTQAEVQLTPQEQRVARAMGLSDAEYAKWR